MGFIRSDTTENGLATEAELLQQVLIANHVVLVDIVQKTAALGDHHQKSTTGVVVLLVVLKMTGEVVDALCQKRDLHVGGPCVLLVQSKALYRFFLSFHSKLFQLGRAN
jgi:hypothetical protein